MDGLSLLQITVACEEVERVKGISSLTGGKIWWSPGPSPQTSSFMPFFDYEIWEWDTVMGMHRKLNETPA